MLSHMQTLNISSSPIRKQSSTTFPVITSTVSHQREGFMSVGGSDLAIFSSTLMGFISWLGGSICASSMSVTPRDQMSAL